MTEVIVLRFYLAYFYFKRRLGIANVMLFDNHQKAGIAPATPIKKTMMTLARLG